jgi:hypothetical protein
VTGAGQTVVTGLLSETPPAEIRQSACNAADPCSLIASEAFESAMMEQPVSLTLVLPENSAAFEAVRIQRQYTSLRRAIDQCNRPRLLGYFNLTEDRGEDMVEVF